MKEALANRCSRANVIHAKMMNRHTGTYGIISSFSPLMKRIGTLVI